ncbi:YggN family protein [Xanthomonas prunicola]|uniref:YggN family protein n=1 Tax=Xanthomonas prunicola TaxID=2053930 RepID=A0A9Q9J2S9_9XANT|nr:YggN family protein [Xanthomonas prunicola]UXA67219.1 YggN family protein [Xanthomonas prunicola]
MTAASAPRNAADPDLKAIPMRGTMFLVPLCLLVACAAQAKTATPQLSAQQCDVSTSYDVLADSGGIWLHRKQGVPRDVFFHGGELNVDHQPQPVSTADAQRLRELEQRTRTLMPAVTSIAQSVVDITFDALNGVVHVLSGSTRQQRKVERLRMAAHAQVEDSLGRGRWEQTVFDERFQANVEHAAQALAGHLTRSVLWTVMTGRTAQMERRGADLDAQMQRQMQGRSDVLEAQARTLCVQAQALYAVQQALEYRFNGERLQMLEVNAHPRTPSEDAPTSNRIVATMTR